jgi:hypothetical protein
MDKGSEMPTTDDLRLFWTIRRSLIHYVSESAGGTVYVGEGAVIDDDAFVFHGVRTPTEFGFTGTVILHAHGGLMHVEICDPRVRRAGDGWVVTVIHRGRPLDFAQVAVLERDGEATIGRGATLHPDAVDLFGGNYQAGAPLDDLRISAPLASAQE